MHYDESREKSQQASEYVQVDNKIVNATFLGLISGTVPNFFNEKVYTRWRNELSFITSRIDFTIIELGKVKGIFSNGKSSDKVLQDKMFIPEFLFEEKNSILPLDATYTLNNSK
jgi:prolipoprotein diacylglyceryltransferase